MISTRLEALRHSMRSSRADAFLLLHLPHIRYLTGFSGSNAQCLVTPSSLWLATDPRYAMQVSEEVSDARIIVAGGPLAPRLLKAARVGSRARLGYDAQRMSVAAHGQLRSDRPGLRWVRMDGHTDTLFSVKSEDELEAIRAAAEISDAVFNEIVEWIRPGMRECDVAAEISYRQRLHGAEGDAFDIIVASGERGALPHAGATWKRIRKGELITMDFGCKVDGLCSDMTRTIAIGNVRPKLRSMYDAVLAAQLVSLSRVHAGIPARAVDAEARRVLRDRKKAAWFRHSLGHGLGLEVHEHPRLAPRSPDTLEAGQVVTIEPGVYIPGTGGVRIEDDIVVTETGVELLTHAPKDLLSI